MPVDYLQGDEDSRLLRFREAITTLGLNPSGGTTSGERVALSKVQRAIYVGDAAAVVGTKVPFGNSQKLIASLAGNKEAPYKAVVSGNIGILELLAALEDSSIPPAKKNNILLAFVEAVTKVAITGAGVANDMSKKYGTKVGDLSGKILTGVRKLDRERETLEELSKKG